MKRNKKLWSYALAGALAVSNMTAVVTMPATSIVALAAYTEVVAHGTSNKITVGAELKDGTSDAGSVKFYGGSTVQIDVDKTSLDETTNALYVMEGTSLIATDNANESISKLIELANTAGKRTFKVYEALPGLEEAEAATIMANDPLDTIEITIIARTVLDANALKSKVQIEDSIVDDSKVLYAGVADTFTVNYSDLEGNEIVPDDARFRLVLADDAADAVSITETTAAGVKYGVQTSEDVTATAAGAYTVNLVYDVDGNFVTTTDQAVIASKEVTVVDGVSMAISQADGRSKLIKATDEINATEAAPSSMSVVATATAEIDTLKPLSGEVNFEIYTADDYDDSEEPEDLVGTKFKAIAPTYDGTASKVAKYTAVINTDKDADGISDAEADKYVLVAYVGDTLATATSVAEYPFEVVELPEDEDIEVKVDVDEVFAGTSGNLSLEVKGAPKGGAKFELQNGTSTKITFNESGSFTIKDTAEAGDTFIFGLKSYTTTDGIVISSANGYTDSTVTVTVAADDLVISAPEEEEQGIAEVYEGNTVALTAKFGSKDVTESVKWTSANTNYVTVDSKGVVTAVKTTENTTSYSGGVTITAEYTKNNTTLTDTFKVKVIENGYTIVRPLEWTRNSFTGRPGDSFKLRLKSNDGNEIKDTVSWETTNPSAAVISGSGDFVTVTIPDEAKSGYTGSIKAKVGNKNATNTIYVAVSSASYAVESEGVKIAYDDEEDEIVYYTATMYVGEIATLTAKNDGQSIDGEWKLYKTGYANETISLSGNKVEAKGAKNANSDDLVYADAVAFYPTGKSDPAIILEIATVEDEIRFFVDGEAIVNDGDVDVEAMEVGEKFTLTIKNGAKDVTSDYTWASEDTSVIKVKNGVVEAAGVGNNAVDVTAKKDGVTVLTYTIGKVVAKSEVKDAAADVVKSAANASDAASTAENAASEAEKAAAATKSNPTAENLTKAETALKAANTSLDNAKAALEEAKAAYKEAEKLGADTASAKAALIEAQDAVYKADDAVKAAEKALASAQTAFDEAATEVEKAKKAEQDKEQEKAKDEAVAKATAAADAAVKDPSDANIAALEKAIDAAVAANAPASDVKALSDKLATALKGAKANSDKATAAAKADAATQKAAAEAANKQLAAQFETLKKAKAANGYVVNTFKSGEATLVSIPANKTKATFTIASKVKVNGKTYKVTKIAAKALKTNTKIKTLTVPATVKQIGANAFGSKVTKLTVKGSNVQVLNNALKSINKKAKVIAKNAYTRTQLKTFGKAKKTVKFSAK